MGNALSILDNVPQLPQDYEEHFGGGNITERVTVPSVTFTGKVWTINYNGEKIKLEKRDEDGDLTPISVMRVVILDYAKRRGRTYYEGEFDPEKPGVPVCWSDDGKTPHESVKEPCAAKCDGCPFSVKGSKITPQGKEVKACAEHRMIVVVPASNLGQFPPLRMKLAVTSDYDARSPELQAQGWYAFSNYMELLRARGVKHSARLVTKMKFDPNAAYPKVLFSVDRWLEGSELGIVGPMTQAEETKALLGGTWSPNGADGTKALPTAAPVVKAAPKAAPAPADDEDDVPPPAPKVKKAAPAPAAEAPKVVKKTKAAPPPADDDDDDVPFEAPKLVKKAKAPPAPAVEDDDDDIPAPKKAKAGAEPVKPAEMPEDLNSLLDEWGDD